MINQYISEDEDPIRISENTIVEKSDQNPRVENVNVGKSKLSQKSIWEFTHFTLTPGYDGNLERQFYDKVCAGNPLMFFCVRQK